MLLNAALPAHFWEHAVRYACWVTNRLPTSGVTGAAIPYTRLYGRDPTLSMAKVFGCLAHVWVDPGLKKPKKKVKFGPRARWAVFLGISPESKGWEFFVPTTGEIGYLSRDAHFHEDLFLMDLKQKGEDLPKYLAGPLEGVREDPFPSTSDGPVTRSERVIRWNDRLEEFATLVPDSHALS